MYDVAGIVTARVWGLYVYTHVVCQCQCPVFLPVRTVTAVYGCRAVDGPDLEYGSTRYGPYRILPVPYATRAVYGRCGALAGPISWCFCNGHAAGLDRRRLVFSLRVATRIALPLSLELSSGLKQKGRLSYRGPPDDEQRGLIVLGR
jgi:hypothetical protein